VSRRRSLKYRNSSRANDRPTSRLATTNGHHLRIPAVGASRDIQNQNTSDETKMSAKTITAGMEPTTSFQNRTTPKP